MKTFKRILLTAVLPAVSVLFLAVAPAYGDDSISISSTGDLGSPQLGDVITICWNIDDDVNATGSGWTSYELCVDGSSENFYEVDSGGDDTYSLEEIYDAGSGWANADFVLLDEYSDYVYYPDTDTRFDEDVSWNF